MKLGLNPLLFNLKPIIQALKQGLDIYFGVGYATNEDSQSIQAYLVVHKKHYWSWEYPRTPHKIEKTKAEHRHWLNLADVRKRCARGEYYKNKKVI